MKTVFPLMAACALVGCASVPLQTPSGKPEVTIQGKTVPQVIAAVTDACKADKGQVEALTADSLVCSHPAPPEMMNIAKAYVQERVHYQLTPASNGIVLKAVSATYDYTGGFGIKHHNRSDLSGGLPLAHIIQASLETIKASLSK